MTLPNFMIIGVAKAGTTSLYREDIRKLEALLDRDLSIWLDGTESTSPLPRNKNLHEKI